MKGNSLVGDWGFKGKQRISKRSLDIKGSRTVPRLWDARRVEWLVVHFWQNK